MIFADDPTSTMFIGFAAMAAVLLWQEHRAHILGLLAYLLRLACPVMHVFMHHGRGTHSHDRHSGANPILTWMYVRLARSEEKDAVARFGDTYRDYARAVAAFIPRLGRPRHSDAEKGGSVGT